MGSLVQEVNQRIGFTGCAPVLLKGSIGNFLSWGGQEYDLSHFLTHHDSADKEGLKGPAVMFASLVSGYSSSSDRGGPRLNIVSEHGTDNNPFTYASAMKFIQEFPEVLARLKTFYSPRREDLRQLVYQMDLRFPHSKSNGAESSGVVLLTGIGLKKSDYFDTDQYEIDTVANEFLRGSARAGILPFYAGANYPYLFGKKLGFIDESSELETHFSKIVEDVRAERDKERNIKTA